MKHNQDQDPFAEALKKLLEEEGNKIEGVDSKIVPGDASLLLKMIGPALGFRAPGEDGYTAEEKAQLATQLILKGVMSLFNQAQAVAVMMSAVCGIELSNIEANKFLAALMSFGPPKTACLGCGGVHDDKEYIEKLNKEVAPILIGSAWSDTQQH